MIEVVGTYIVVGMSRSKEAAFPAFFTKLGFLIFALGTQKKTLTIVAVGIKYCILLAKNRREMKSMLWDTLMSFRCNVSCSCFMSSRKKINLVFSIEFAPSKCPFSFLLMGAGYRISVTPIVVYSSVPSSAGIFQIVSLNISSIQEACELSTQLSQIGNLHLSISACFWSWWRSLPPEANPAHSRPFLKDQSQGAVLSSLDGLIISNGSVSLPRASIQAMFEVIDDYLTGTPYLPTPLTAK